MTPTTWIQESYPWTKQPLIANAPMGSFVSPELVVEVTRAGGFGFLGAGYDTKTAGDRLHKTRSLLSQIDDAALIKDDRLPVGVGFLCFAVELDAVVELLKEYKPIAVWLFAADDEADYATWAARIREAVSAHIWIQTNSVEQALGLAKTAKPDVLVMQGTDAGGHGSIKGAGIISLLPETADALTEAGFGHIPLIAAGGIADGRGVAAALTLGASGITLGTRFLASDEIAMPDRKYQQAILSIQDGGQTTTKSQIFDEVQYPKGNIWPKSYDGRAIRNASVTDAENGVDVDHARKRYAEDKTFKSSMVESHAVAWAGTGVGLVRTVEPSFKIVTEVRESAVKILRGFAS